MALLVVTMEVSVLEPKLWPTPEIVMIMPPKPTAMRMEERLSQALIIRTVQRKALLVANEAMEEMALRIRRENEKKTKKEIRMKRSRI